MTTIAETAYNSYTSRSTPLSFRRSGSLPLAPPETFEKIINHATNEKKEESQSTKLGIISAAAPTVSHLLAENPQYRKEMWQILDLPANRKKSFTAIPNGALISIDPQSKEISWSSEKSGKEGNSSPAVGEKAFAAKLLQAEKGGQSSVKNMTDIKLPKPTAKPSSKKADKTTSPPADLSEAVQHYLGTPYNKLNCYNLVVRGLKDLGIQYRGKEGLQHKLIGMAVEKGLPANAYLTGEGLTKAVGSRLLFESYLRVSNPAGEAQKMLAKMKNILQKGQILSFSTPTKGHTGVISRQEDGNWTFINSGRMDNPVAPVNSRHEVGEEHLLAELTNWFSLAKRRRESLTVTLGQIGAQGGERAEARIETLAKTTSAGGEGQSGQKTHQEVEHKPLLVSI